MKKNYIFYTILLIWARFWSVCCRLLMIFCMIFDNLGYTNSLLLIASYGVKARWWGRNFATRWIRQTTLVSQWRAQDMVIGNF